MRKFVVLGLMIAGLGMAHAGEPLSLAPPAPDASNPNVDPVTQAVIDSLDRDIRANEQMLRELRHSKNLPYNDPDEDAIGAELDAQQAQRDYEEYRREDYLEEHGFSVTPQYPDPRYDVRR